MLNREPFNFIRHYRRLVAFCVVFLLGLVAGALYIDQYSFSSLMLLLEYPQMSIVVGFLVSALPFVVFYIFFRRSAFLPILPFAFFKAFTFMYCFAGVSVAYADAGWLVRCLLLFSDCFTVPLLIWYVAVKLMENRKIPDREIWFCLLCVFAVRCMDSFVISPFVSRLLLL